MEDDCAFSNSSGLLVAKVVAYSIIFFLSAFGNAIVIFVVLKTKRPRGVMDIFIVNMAFSDLFVPLLIVPKELYEIISRSMEWQVGQLAGVVLCKAYFFIIDISPLVSILTLCSITVERFLAVTRPKLPSHRESKLQYIVVALTWIVAMGYCAPYFYTFKLELIGNENSNGTGVTNGSSMLSCGINWSPAFDHVATQKAYTTTTCMLFIIIPFCCMATMYVFLFFKARASYKLVENSMSTRAKRRRNIKMWTMLKLSIAVVVGFAICWAPYNVQVFLLIFVWDWQLPTSCFYKNFHFVAMFMSVSNAAINPWIYLVFVERFKQHLRDMGRSFGSMINLRPSSPKQQTSQKTVKDESNKADVEYQADQE